MDFEKFKEEYYKKHPMLPEVDPSGLSLPDTLIEVVRTNMEMTLDILEEYNSWLQKEIENK